MTLHPPPPPLPASAPPSGGAAPPSPIPNVALLGALLAQTGVVGLDSLQRAISQRFTPAVAERNALAARDAYEHALDLLGAIAGSGSA